MHGEGKGRGREGLARLVGKDLQDLRDLFDYKKPSKTHVDGEFKRGKRFPRGPMPMPMPMRS